MSWFFVFRFEGNLRVSFVCLREKQMFVRQPETKLQRYSKALKRFEILAQIQVGLKNSLEVLKLAWSLGNLTNTCFSVKHYKSGQL